MNLYNFIVKILILVYLIIILFIGCDVDNRPLDKVVETKKSNYDVNLVGHWVQPNPINNREVQGFKLTDDGTARSINMETLKYENWWKKGDSLFLVARSIGNRVSFIDTSSYLIMKYNRDTLLLRIGTKEWLYLRTVSK